MDAVEFIREWKRMCESTECCGDCAGRAARGKGGTCMLQNVENPAKLAAAVEEWSKEHPRKTRQSEFLKQWPKAKKAEDGVLCIRPCFLMADYQKESCKDTYIDEWGSDCYPCVSKFWMQEVD